MNAPAFDGIVNFRDVGGCPAGDGRRVRTGLLYRCGHLGNASDADIELLEALGVHMVVDFRAPRERQIEGESRLPRGATVAHLPMGDVAAGGDIREVLGSGDVERIRAMFPPGAAREMMLRGARSFVVDASNRTQYAAFVRMLAEPGGTPALVHCSAGKDRTGWAIAVVLLALGVPEQVVIDDYLRSNEARAAWMANTARTVAGGFDLSLLEPLVLVHPDYLGASFAALDEHWGGIDGYLEAGLGVDARARRRLRSVFLEPAAVDG